MRLPALPVLALCALATACDKTVGVALEGAAAPPRFRLSGNLPRFSFIVSTPRESSPTQPRFDVIWHVVADSQELLPADAPVIVYGAAPQGMHAVRFSPDAAGPQPAGPPPALVEGRLYIATISGLQSNLVSSGFREARVCFTLANGAVAPAPCPPRS